MNGAGNAFAVFDARARAFAPDKETIQEIAKQTGSDQILAIERDATRDAFMRIWNADGEEVAACGNGTRAVAHLLLEAGHSSRANRPPPCPKGLPHSTPPTPTRYLPTPGAQRRLLAASHLCVPSPDRAQTELRQSSDRAESSNRAHAEIRHISDLSQTSLTELKS